MAVSEIMKEAIYKNLSEGDMVIAFDVKTQSGFEMDAVSIKNFQSTTGEDVWSFYEIATTESEFLLKKDIDLLGEYNYFVLPNDVYTLVYKKIPKKAGVYVLYKSGVLKLIKKAKNQVDALHTRKPFLRTELVIAMSNELKKMREERVVTVKEKIFPIWNTLTEKQKESFFLDMYGSFDFCARCDYNDTKKCKICIHNRNDNFSPSKAKKKALA